MSSKDPYDYSDYIVGVGHNKSPADVPELTRLAKEQHALEQEVFQLETKLTETKEKLRNVSERLLPEKMEELGVSEFTTKEGIGIEIEDKTKGYLTIENRPAGHKWLEENGAGAIIKSHVVIPYGRNELEDAKKLVDELKERKRIATLEREVHWKTLDSYINERLEEGKDIPLDIFSVDRRKIAKVTVEK